MANAPEESKRKRAVMDEDGPGRLPPPWSTYLAHALKTLQKQNVTSVRQIHCGSDEPEHGHEAVALSVGAADVRAGGAYVAAMHADTSRSL